MKKGFNKKIILILGLVFIIASFVYVLKDVNETKRDIVSYDLENGLIINRIVDYDGMYMEDGSDEKVDDVLGIIIENRSASDLQYAEIYLEFENKTARFNITNLRNGDSCLVLESERFSTDEMPTKVYCSNVVYYSSLMNIKADQLEINGMKGALNIRNISEEDINGDIYVYYKHYADGMFMGGITYRTKVSGLKAGELRQVMTQHYSNEDCIIVHVDILGN